MGRRGPKPTPTKILKLRGSWRGELNADEPEIPEQKTEPPAHLDGEVLAEFNRIIADLESMKLETPVDIRAVERYANLWVQWKHLNEEIKKLNGSVTFVVKDEEKRVKSIRPLPHLRIARDMGMELLRLEQEFGLTPSARTRIRVEKREQNKPKLMIRDRTA